MVAPYEAVPGTVSYRVQPIVVSIVGERRSCAGLPAGQPPGARMYAPWIEIDAPNSVPSHGIAALKPLSGSTIPNVAPTWRA